MLIITKTKEREMNVKKSKKLGIKGNTLSLITSALLIRAPLKIQ